MNNQGLKHPDSMSRAEMIKKIESFSGNSEAMSWWLRNAAHRVSRMAFNNARLR